MPQLHEGETLRASRAFRFWLHSLALFGPVSEKLPASTASVAALGAHLSCFRVMAAAVMIRSVYHDVTSDVYAGAASGGGEAAPLFHLSLLSVMIRSVHAGAAS